MEAQQEGDSSHPGPRNVTEVLYENCVIQSPSGEMLSRCGRKKAEWYIKKGLAGKRTSKTTRLTALLEQVLAEPLTVKLLFAPGGRYPSILGSASLTSPSGHAGDAYMLSEKENRCVVCGASQDLTKHHVVGSLSSVPSPHQKNRCQRGIESTFLRS
jgi:hypothetical protein